MVYLHVVCHVFMHELSTSDTIPDVQSSSVVDALCSSSKLVCSAFLLVLPHGFAEFSPTAYSGCVLVLFGTFQKGAKSFQMITRGRGDRRTWER